MSKVKIFSINQPWAIAVLYFIVGVNWIFFSDILISSIFSDNIREMSRFQLIKGCLYVLLTGLTLYYLINKLYNKVNGGKQELELLFTNPNLGIFKVNQEGYFTYVSPNILDIIGYSDKDIIGKKISDFTPADYLEEDQEKLNKIRNSHSETSFIFNKHLQDINGNVIIIELYGILLNNKKGLPQGYLAAFQNITKQETFLHSLTAKNKQLEELASDQSHLVRAPLARILGIVELFENIELDATEKNNLIKHLKSSGQELDAALKNISQKMSST